MTQPPKVSICIPTYNYGRFLTDAIGSSLSQTFRDTEVLVLDNASTDETPDIVRRFVEADPRVRYIRNAENIGHIANFNRCLELARGEYIKFLCADDALEPECVAKSVEALDANPRVTLVGCGRRLIDEEGKEFGYSAWSDRKELVPGVEAIVRCLFFGNKIGEPSATMLRRKDAGEGFRSSYLMFIDLDLWFRLLEKGDFLFIPEGLCKFRSHSSQGAQTYIFSLKPIRDQIGIYLEYGRKDYVRLSPIKRLELILRRLAFCVTPPLIALVAKVYPVRRYEFPPDRTVR